MTYTVHPRAELDLAEASDFYVKQAGEVVARRFLAEFERVARLVDRNPEAGAEIRKNRRRFPSRSIPIHGDLQEAWSRHPGIGRAPSVSQAKLWHESAMKILCTRRHRCFPLIRLVRYFVEIYFL